MPSNSNLEELIANLGPIIDRLVAALGRFVSLLMSPDTWSWDKWRPLITWEFVVVFFPFAFILLAGMLSVFRRKQR